MNEYTKQAVDLNSNYILAAREDAVIKPFSMSALEIDYINKRKPWVAAIWSVIMPRIGSLYIHKIISAFYLLS